MIQLIIIIIIIIIIITISKQELLSLIFIYKYSKNIVDHSNKIPEAITQHFYYSSLSCFIFVDSF